MSIGMEGVRRRIKALQVDMSQGYGPWMHERGFYEPVGDSKWTDEKGVMHIAVPSRITEKGRRYNVPYVEITYDPNGR